jgi:1,4-alpha-glucan branching enzyme
MRTEVSLTQLGKLVEGRHENPASILGPHRIEYQGQPALAVRTFQPNSQQVWLVHEPHGGDSAAEFSAAEVGQEGPLLANGSRGVPRPMRRIHPAGFYEAIVPLNDNQLNGDQHSYRIRVAKQNGEIITMHDPYAVPSILSDFDRYLLGSGQHRRLYERLGAQVRSVGNAVGVNFAVWAPNARAVQVIGDFNDWDGRKHGMKGSDSGVWEIFIPEAKAGHCYKYRVLTCHGYWVDKSDPVGFAAELPPMTASIVSDLNTYQWNDTQWMERRRNSDVLSQPMSIYEVHLGSWMQGGDRSHGWFSYQELAHRLVEYCKQMHFTHIELMPVSEHPFTGSWGYQTVGYFAATSRYGTPQDFMYFVDYCHQHDIGVILDWVPAHFPRDAHGLAEFDGTALYEHGDPRQGEHPDWGTKIFNYGRNEVRNFLIANGLFWLDRYHIDGLRVDAVASMLYLDYSRKHGEWVPNQYGGRENLEALHFLREFNAIVHEDHPGALTIAEESTAWPGVSRPVADGGLGFSLKWNMGWMNDTLRYFHNDPIHRKYHHNELTFSLIYAFTENFTLPLSHDEVVHGKGALLSQMPGDMWQKFANLRLLYSYMWTHPGKKLLFMGGEIGMWNEWNHDRGVEWSLLDFDTHRGVQRCVADLNRIVIENPALHQCDFGHEGFEWVDCMNSEDSILSYLRKSGSDDPLILVCSNFTPVVRSGYRVGVPKSGFWREIFNSDAAIYGGSNVGNFPGVQSSGHGHHGRPDSLSIHLPPLGVSVFRYEG